MRKILSFLLVLAALVVSPAHAQSNNLSIIFLYPTNGEVVNAPLFLRVATGDSNATVVSVQYFAGTNSIGIVSNYPIAYPLIPEASDSAILPGTLPIFYSPFMLYWNPSPGNYVLTAEATDDQGNIAL